MDLAEAHFETLRFLLSGNGKIINLNIGNSKGTSVLQLIKTFERVSQIKIPYIFTKKRKGDVARLVADNHLATKLLGWEPSRNLEQMCLDGWRWKTLNPYGYKNLQKKIKIFLNKIFILNFYLKANVFRNYPQILLCHLH